MLKYCSTACDETRCLAAELIYILLRLNYTESKAGIGKVRTQLTVAISRNDILEPASLKRALLLTELLAQSDPLAGKTIQKLVGVLSG